MQSRAGQVGSGDWPFETRASYDMDTFTRIVYVVSKQPFAFVFCIVELPAAELADVSVCSQGALQAQALVIPK